MDLLSRLNMVSSTKILEPREIFMSLPSKVKQYEYPRDVQSDVWRKWFINRNKKNTIIKMNTGSGKTIVGLMILQSCLNEGKGPAIYIVPDRYLVDQVCNEAKKLGIKVTKDKNNYFYTENKAILVMTIYSLVNGRSFFGMRSEPYNFPIESVLIDDVHACIKTISTQFSLKIPFKHDLYKKVIEIIRDSWKLYNEKSYLDITVSLEKKAFLLPFWMWQKFQSSIYKVLKEYDDGEEENNFVYFNLPLIKDCFSICNCVIKANLIEITPMGIPISKISSFDKASRRIFMSATLEDDSVFVSSLGLEKKQIETIVTPEKANDIGDRLMLFPKHLNSDISDDEIKRKVLDIARTHNVIVIVPSIERSHFWDNTNKTCVLSGNIINTVSELKNGYVGLRVFVNRYDGIDLPGDACRLLVIDKLPPLNTNYDQVVQSINSSCTLAYREQIQRIEQGMGRGVRSNNDSCCILFMGNQLEDVLLRKNGIKYFSNSTLAQYNLSKSLWSMLLEESSKPTIDQIFNLLNFSLNRDIRWIEKSREILSNIQYNTKPKIDENTVALRESFEFALLREWQKAADVLSNIIAKETDKNQKGYLMQIKASYVNFINFSSAQQIVKKAYGYNQSMFFPIKGIEHTKLINTNNQAKELIENLKSISNNPNEINIFVLSLLDNLTFLSNYDDFERALEKIGKLLGFDSNRLDNIGGPDNLWAIGDDTYMVIECKNEANSSTISKDYCNQLAGSIRWFENNYSGTCTSIPIIIERCSTIDSMATAVPKMRIINEASLLKFKDSVQNFFMALVSENGWEIDSNVSKLLEFYNLRGKDLIKNYTIPYRLSRN